MSFEFGTLRYSARTEGFVFSWMDWHRRLARSAGPWRSSNGALSELAGDGWEVDHEYDPAEPSRSSFLLRRPVTAVSHGRDTALLPS